MVWSNVVQCNREEKRSIRWIALTNNSINLVSKPESVSACNCNIEKFNEGMIDYKHFSSAAAIAISGVVWECGMSPSGLNPHVIAAILPEPISFQ